MKQRDEICNEAIRRAGGAQRLAQLLDCTHQAIYKWTSVPMTQVFAVSRITGIPEKVLRADKVKFFDDIERNKSRSQPKLQPPKGINTDESGNRQAKAAEVVE